MIGLILVSSSSKPNQSVEPTADSALCFDLESPAGGGSRWR